MLIAKTLNVCTCAWVYARLIMEDIHFNKYLPVKNSELEFLI